MNDKLSRQNCVLYVCGIVPVVWLALLAAPLLEGGLGTLLEGFGTALENPFHIVWCDKSLKTLLIFLMLYGLDIGIYVSNECVYRRREEQGSARWGNPLSIAKRYQQSGNANKLLTQQVALGLDGRKHHRNLNVLICGGSGAGKTRYYAKPNIMQANTSFVILDPKGELLRDTGHLLEEKGYVIKVLDLINPERSHCYNPFVYLRDDDDIQRLATNIMKNTTPKDSKSSDHFWEDMAAMLLKALISYLHYEAPPEEQNFPMVMDMIRAGDVKEDNEEYVSTLDELFERLERKNPEHIAVRYYKGYHSGSGKTLKSIQITLVSRLEKFNLESLAGMTQTDEMELWSLGEKKTAIFAVIPDNDSSFNFIVGLLYTQLFQQLYYQADVVHGGRLPVHVRCLIDECANIGQIPNLEKLVATIRSREISACLVLQTKSQLKAIYKDNADTIIGNMDSQIFLGGSEPGTLKDLSEMLGKETIDSFNTSDTRGSSPSYGTSFQKLGHELLSRDEIAVLDGGKCILQLRGVRPFLSDKYDLTQHPNYKLTSDYDPKNTFDIEKYLNRKEKIHPGDEFIVVDADSLPSA